MTPLGTLWREADRFLSSLIDREGGVARTRSRLAEMTDLYGRPATRPANAPRCGFLGEALTGARNGPAAHLAEALAAVDLHWESYDAYAPDTIGPRFPQQHAYASLIAGVDPDWGRDFDIGFLLIAPGTLYRDHHHLASELYAPMTGPTYWRFGTATAWMEKMPGDIVWNPPQRVHATLVRDTPLLCLYAWTENVHAAAVVDFSGDWQDIEAAISR
jgi:hypothetical protein